MPETRRPAHPANAKADADLVDEALRRLLQSSPVDRSSFETRRTEEEKLYKRLVELSGSRAAGSSTPER